MMNHAGSLDTEKTRRSMKLFADEVYPELKALDPGMVADPALMPVEPQPAVAERVMRAEG